MNIGIVGHEAAKFTAEGEEKAKDAIRTILVAHEKAVLVSGACHLGGVDIWAEEIADELRREKLIFPPRFRSWSRGYRPRNIEIANASDAIWCVVVNSYPLTYHGIHFKGCYHCNTTDHVKSGGCWTARYAMKLLKPATWVVIHQEAVTTLHSERR